MAVVCGIAPALAGAQPLDPYRPAAPASPAPAPAPSTAPATPSDVDAAVAGALLDRARTLLAAGELTGARQLAGEAAAQDPDGPTGAAARALVADLDRQLAPPPPLPPPPVELPPPVPVARVIAPPAAPPGHHRSARKFHLLGTGVLWGAAAGGLFADVATGTTGTTGKDIIAGAGLGAIVGALVGSTTAGDPDLTLDDAALIHSATLWGLIGGLTTATAIDPPEGEAYSLNATLGIVGGYVVGQYAARHHEISSRRLVRVNALAVLGAGVPMLLWQLTRDAAAVTDGPTRSQQGWGLLATAGLVGGVYLGFRWTRGMDHAQAAASPTAQPADTLAPIALFARGADGTWTAGGLGLVPVSHGRGAALSLLAGRW